jgi:biopolymer transport protein ExbD
MTHGATVKALTTATLCAVASCGNVPDDTERGDNPPLIEIRADGRHCVILRSEIECSDVVTHLRNVVKLAPGSAVRLKADKTASYNTVAAVLSAVQKSEYTTQIGYVVVSEPAEAP